MDQSLAKIRHERSKKDFPGLKLEDDEYVEFAFRRAKVCLFMIWGCIAIALIIVLISFLFVLMGQSTIDETGMNFLFIVLATLVAVTFIGGFIALMIHNGNRIFITN